MVYIATFTSGRYLEDNKILGIYSSNEKAERAIQHAIDIDKIYSSNYPLRYQQYRDYYDILDAEIDEHII